MDSLDELLELPGVSEEYEDNYEQHGGDPPLKFRAYTLQRFRGEIQSISEEKVNKIMTEVPAKREAKANLGLEIQQMEKELQTLRESQTPEEKKRYDDIVAEIKKAQTDKTEIQKTIEAHKAKKPQEIGQKLKDYEQLLQQYSNQEKGFDATIKQKENERDSMSIPKKEREINNKKEALGKLPDYPPDEEALKQEIRDKHLSDIIQETAKLLFTQPVILVASVAGDYKEFTKLSELGDLTQIISVNGAAFQRIFNNPETNFNFSNIVFMASRRYDLNEIRWDITLLRKKFALMMFYQLHFLVILDSEKDVGTLRFAKLTPANQLVELTKRMTYLQGKISAFSHDPTKYITKYFWYIQMLWLYTDTNFPMSQSGGGIVGGAGGDSENPAKFDKGPLLEFIQTLESLGPVAFMEQIINPPEEQEGWNAKTEAGFEEDELEEDEKEEEESLDEEAAAVAAAAAAAEAAKKKAEEDAVAAAAAKAAADTAIAAAAAKAAADTATAADKDRLEKEAAEAQKKADEAATAEEAAAVAKKAADEAAAASAKKAADDEAAAAARVTIKDKIADDVVKGFYLDNTKHISAALKAFQKYTKETGKADDYPKKDKGDIRIFGKIRKSFVALKQNLKLLFTIYKYISEKNALKFKREAFTPVLKPTIKVTVKTNEVEEEKDETYDILGTITEIKKKYEAQLTHAQKFKGKEAVEEIKKVKAEYAEFERLEREITALLGGDASKYETIKTFFKRKAANANIAKAGDIPADKQEEAEELIGNIKETMTKLTDVYTKLKSATDPKKEFLSINQKDREGHVVSFTELKSGQGAWNKLVGEYPALLDSLSRAETRTMNEMVTFYDQKVAGKHVKFDNS